MLLNAGCAAAAAEAEAELFAEPEDLEEEEDEPEPVFFALDELVLPLALVVGLVVDVG